MGELYELLVGFPQKAHDSPDTNHNNTNGESEGPEEVHITQNNYLKNKYTGRGEQKGTGAQLASEATIATKGGL